MSIEVQTVQTVKLVLVLVVQQVKLSLKMNA